MPEAPSLAVIIPAYNAERFLERAVESVFATGYPGIEVAIVDDGSTDGTLAVAWNLERRWAGRCTVLRHPNGAQMGVSASRNLGIEESRSDWLAFLDADDQYFPHRFDDFREALERNERFDALYGMAEVRYDSGGLCPTPSSTEYFGISERLFDLGLLGRLLQGQTWAVSAITLRRSVLYTIGLFDTERRIAEDCHLWMRLAVCSRIIPGILERPVSIYWRHDQNTYTYKLEHRLSLLDAMLDVDKNLERYQPDEGIANVFRESVKGYAHRSWLAAMDARRPSVAWRIWIVMLGKWPLPKTMRLFAGCLRATIPWFSVPRIQT